MAFPVVTNIKTTVLGVLQWIVLLTFLVAKLKGGTAFSDAEIALITALSISGAKGVVAADAQKVQP